MSISAMNRVPGGGRPVMVAVVTVAWLVSCDTPSPNRRTAMSQSAASRPARPDGSTEDGAEGCVIAIDVSNGTVTLDGEDLSDLDREALHAVLGEPSRTNAVEKTEDIREFGNPIESNDGANDRTIWEREVTERHEVYDMRGLVFRASSVGEDASEVPLDRMRIFFESERRFDTPRRPKPEVVPRTRGTCSVSVNGYTLHPDAALVSDDVGDEPVELFGASFLAMRSGPHVDALYADDAGISLRLFLDGPDSGRPAYLDFEPVP